MSNSLDADLNLDYLQKLSEDNTSRQRAKGQSYIVVLESISFL